MLRQMKGSGMDTQHDTSAFELPEWLLEPKWLQFAEGEDDDDDGDEDPPKGKGSDDDDDDDDDSDDDDDDDEEPKKGKKSSDKGEDTAGLKSALSKERKRAKAAEKEAKALRKFKEDQEKKGKSAAENATAEATKATEKAARLATRLQDNEVNLAIIKAVQRDPKLKFRDIDDALSLVKRGDIEVEQDEDDPSDIEVDEDSVVKALKRLAKRKPHLLVAAEDDDDEDDDEDEDELPRRRQKSTGSKVGSRGTRDRGKAKDEQLIDAYPMLAAARPVARQR
jgi:hypothetical protein